MTVTSESVVARTAPNGSTHAALLEAAERVFSDRSFLDATVSDIVEVAGVARGTFYLYFKNKEDAFEAVVSRVVHDMFGGAQARVSGDNPFERIRERNRIYLEIFRRHLGVMRNFYLADPINPRVASMHKRFQETFIERIRRGLARDMALGPDERLDLDTASWALGLMVEYFVYTWLAAERVPNAQALDTDTVLDTLSGLMYRVMYLKSATMPAAPA
jgi:AcrR family transcriptional regulator